MSIKYTIKKFGNTRMLSCYVGEVECLSYTVQGLIETIKAYKETKWELI